MYLDVVGVVNIKLTKEMKSLLFCSAGYIVARKGKEGKGRGGFAILVKNCLTFQEIVKDGLFRQYSIGRVTVGREWCSYYMNLQRILTI